MQASKVFNTPITLAVNLLIEPVFFFSIIPSFMSSSKTSQRSGIFYDLPYPVPTFYRMSDHAFDFKCLETEVQLAWCLVFLSNVYLCLCHIIIITLPALDRIARYDGNIVVFFQQSMLTINSSITAKYKIKLPSKHFYHFQSFVLMLCCSD